MLVSQRGAPIERRQNLRLPRHARRSSGHKRIDASVTWLADQQSWEASLSDAAVGLSALLQILLVIVLGQVILGGGNDLSHDRLPEASALIQSLFRRDRGGPLLWSVKEDGGAILLAYIRSLP